MKGLHVVRALTATAWAIHEDKLHEILAVVDRWLSGQSLGPLTIRAEDDEDDGPRPHFESLRGARRDTADQQNVIAVLPLRGVIAHRMNMLTSFSGGVSTEKFGQEFMQAVRDPNVAEIVIDVDSPGGAVEGTEELAKKIFDARGSKPITAVVNSFSASAAYWIAAQADKVVIMPSGEAGSVGVFVLHSETSKANEEAGVKHTFIVASSSPHKVEGNSLEPLSEAAKKRIQQQVDFHMNRFVRDVARGRGVDRDKVTSSFGGGRMLNSRESIQHGLADEIGTMDDVIAAAAKRIRGRAGRRAATKLDDERAFALENPGLPVPVGCNPEEQDDGSFVYRMTY